MWHCCTRFKFLQPSPAPPGEPTEENCSLSTTARHVINHRLSSPLFHCLHLANTPARQRSTAYHMLSFLSRHTLGKSPLFTCCSILKVTGLRENNSGDSPQDDESVLIHIFRPFQAATQFSLCKSRGTECRGATLCSSHGTGAGVAAQRERKRTGGTEKKNCPTKK